MRFQPQKQREQLPGYRSGSPLVMGTGEPPLALTDVSLRQGGVDSGLAGSRSSQLVPGIGNHSEASA